MSQKNVGMIRKYHNHTLQTNPQHYKEESQYIRKIIKVKQPDLSSPNPSEHFGTEHNGEYVLGIN